MSKYRKYYTGQYGLVDKTNRNIWLNIDNESLAHDVCRVFASKVGLLVFDLTIFENFVLDPPTVDSEVCFKWQVPPAQFIEKTYLSIYDYPQVDTITQYHSTKLVNQSTRSLLSLERQQELQEQMMLYIQLRQSLFLNPAFGSVIDYTLARRNLIANLDTVFSTEINISDIEHSIIDLAKQHINNDNFLNLYLLSFFNRLYA